MTLLKKTKHTSNLLTSICQCWNNTFLFMFILIISYIYLTLLHHFPTSCYRPPLKFPVLFRSLAPQTCIQYSKQWQWKIIGKKQEACDLFCGVWIINLYFVSGGARGKIKTIVLMQTILKRSSSPKHYENSVIKCSQRHDVTEMMEIDRELL